MLFFPFTFQNVELISSFSVYLFFSSTSYQHTLSSCIYLSFFLVVPTATRNDDYSGNWLVTFLVWHRHPSYPGPLWRWPLHHHSRSAFICLVCTFFLSLLYIYCFPSLFDAFLAYFPHFSDRGIPQEKYFCQYYLSVHDKFQIRYGCAYFCAMGLITCVVKSLILKSECCPSCFRLL